MFCRCKRKPQELGCRASIYNARDLLPCLSPIWSTYIYLMSPSQSFFFLKRYIRWYQDTSSVAWNGCSITISHLITMHILRLAGQGGQSPASSCLCHEGRPLSAPASPSWLLKLHLTQSYIYHYRIVKSSDNCLFWLFPFRNRYCLLECCLLFLYFTMHHVEGECLVRYYQKPRFRGAGQSYSVLRNCYCNTKPSALTKI